MARGPKPVSVLLTAGERDALQRLVRRHGAGQAAVMRARIVLAADAEPQTGQIERRSHDYKRHGTNDLFAALDVRAGTVIGTCKGRHRSTEFRAFLDQVEAAVPADLDVHLVLDNAATHKTRLVHDWLLKRPR